MSQTDLALINNKLTCGPTSVTTTQQCILGGRENALLDNFPRSLFKQARRYASHVAVHTEAAVEQTVIDSRFCQCRRGFGFRLMLLVANAFWCRLASARAKFGSGLSRRVATHTRHRYETEQTRMKTDHQREDVKGVLRLQETDEHRSALVKTRWERVLKIDHAVRSWTHPYVEDPHQQLSQNHSWSSATSNPRRGAVCLLEVLGRFDRVPHGDTGKRRLVRETITYSTANQGPGVASGACVCFSTFVM
ncbi:hypothetical protein IRJ41_006184 [Triplophysa rosa]|uniref:Uncharacterized protein n=1 Tax=Triplophysa rosa TaxID=992332 RepID=A0A9W7W9D5_TRIRA|nr:hypothetical protein IRJ41_006184 [Triplophysa rosa]